MQSIQISLNFIIISNMQLKETIVEGLKDGKARDVVCIDMRKVNGSICDYFIIAHGDSATHIDGINRSRFMLLSLTLEILLAQLLIKGI